MMSDAPGPERDTPAVARPARRAPSRFHLYLLVVTLAAVLGQIPLGVFRADSPLDSTAHVLLPAAATALLYDLLYSRSDQTLAQQFLTMVLLGVSSEMVWEVLEFTADNGLGLAWQLDNTDTMHDIIGGIVGSLLGAGIRVATVLHRRRPVREPDSAAVPAISYRLSHNHAGGFAYQGLWVLGANGFRCRHWHPSVTEAEHCARDAWERAKPAVRRLVSRSVGPAPATASVSVS